MFQLETAATEWCTTEKKRRRAKVNLGSYESIGLAICHEVLRLASIHFSSMELVRSNNFLYM
jgi:hypothetical protein